MKISDFIKESFSASSDISKKSTKTTGNDFMNILAERETKVKNQKEVKPSRKENISNDKTSKNDVSTNKYNKKYSAKAVASSDKSENVVAVNNSVSKTPVSERKAEASNENKVESNKEVNEQVQTEDKIVEQSVSPVIANKDDNEEQIIQKIAEILGVDVSEVKEALNSLDLNLEDLSDNSKISKLMLKVLKLDEPAELLNVENVKENIVDIKSLIDEAVDKNLITNSKEIFNMEKAKSDNALQSAITNPVLSSDKLLDASEDSFEMPTEVKADSEEHAKPIEKAQVSSENDESANNESFLSNQNSNLEVETADSAKGITGISETGKTEASFSKNLTNNVLRSNQQDVISQIVDKVKVEVKGNVNQITISLKPEHLGDVSLKVSTENGIITASFIAQNEKVKEIIEQNFNSLKDSLQEQGIKIEGLSVSVGGKEQGFQSGGSSSSELQSRNYDNKNIFQDDEFIDLDEQSSVDTKNVYNNSVEYTI